MALRTPPPSPSASAASRLAAAWRRLSARREGATVIEYCLIAALLGIAVFIGGGFLADASVGAWEDTILPAVEDAMTAEGE